jgi:membrane protein implicated in regulation of membrane protease activity
VLALGVVLVAAAIIMALVEAHASTGGLIAGIGVVALVCGVVFLSAGAGVGALGVIAVAAVVLAASLGALYVLGRSLVSVRSLRPRSGPEAMVGHVGVVRGGSSAPRVYVDGSLWRASPSVLDEGAALHDGDRVVVERVSGLTLGVRKAEEWELYP